MIRIRQAPLLHSLFWVFLLLSGLAVRCIGIRHGEANGMVYHPDVAKQSLVARYAYRGPPNIQKIFNNDFRKVLYPYGSAILLSRAARISSALTGNRKLHLCHRFYWALWLRYVSVATILIGTLPLLWALRRQLGGKTAALAGVLLLFEPINVQLSHYGMNDVPLLAFLFLTIAAALQMPRERKIPIFSLLAGIAAGISFAIKYQGVLALIFPGLFWLLLIREKGSRWAALSLIAVGAGFLAGFLPLSPLLLHEPAAFFSTFPVFMEWQAHIMGEAIPLGTKLQTNLIALGTVTFQHGYFLLWLGGLWAGIYAIRHRHEVRIAAPVFSILLFCGLLLLAMLFSRDIVRVNDLMPLFALLIVAAAFPASNLLARSHSNGQRMALLLPAAALVVIFICVSFQDSLALHRTDTRIRARQWCDENLPPNVVVAYEMYSLEPTREDLKCFRTRYLSAPILQDTFRKNQVDYIITSSLASSRFADRASPFYSPGTQAIYEDLFAHCTLRASFHDRRLLHAHPDLAIYEWIPPPP